MHTNVKFLIASVLEGDMVKLSLEEWDMRQFQNEMALYGSCTLIHPWNWLAINWTSLVAQTVKHLPTMRETWVQFLDREDPLEKEMATHSSTLAWKIPWMEEPGILQSMGSQRVRHD